MANLCLAYFYLSEKCFIFLTSVPPYGNIDSHAGFGKVDPVIRSGWSWSGDPADRIRNIYKIPDQDRITKNYKNSDRITNFGLPTDPEFKTAGTILFQNVTKIVIFYAQCTKLIFSRNVAAIFSPIMLRLLVLFDKNVAIHSGMKASKKNTFRINCGSIVTFW